MSELYLSGCKVSNLSLKELLTGIHKEIRKQEKDNPSIMLSANIHGFNQAYKHEWLKTLNNEAELVRNDSAGISLAGKILGTPIKDRMTWADFGWDLAAFCEKEELTQYFLGNKPGIPEKAKDVLQEKHPGLKVVGTHHGYFKKEGPENEAVIKEINSKKPDILIVGFGMPLQEKWILDNRKKLDVGIIMTGGNCFTFLAGEESRAPNWMHKNGLEWLYRLVKEPVRMFDRYIIGNPLFMFRVFLQKFGLKYKTKNN
jgi:N-acetylglucosaminyldiphosphoundecaprenol N-acetyl-beta-D-mannosaminyltransferase